MCTVAVKRALIPLCNQFIEPGKFMICRRVISSSSSSSRCWITALATSLAASHLLGMNVKSLSCVLLFFASLTQAHESHSHEPASDDAAPGQYAQRHVRVSFTSHASSRFEYQPC